MAANWNNPTLTSLYVDFLAELKARDVDVLTMAPGTNLPVGAKRWNSPTSTFQEWNGSAWVNLILSGAGGGTGTGAFPTLGTMAGQNSNAVAITGGTITGVNLNGSDITSGIVALARGGTGASLALGVNGHVLMSLSGAVVFSDNASALTNINASAITHGNLAAARLPNGGTWANTVPLIYSLTGSAYVQMFGASLLMGAATGGNLGNGTINVSGGYYLNGVPLAALGIPSGLMAYFSGLCPAGWTFVAGSAGRTVRSTNGGAGGQGGADNHNHGFNVPAGGGGNIPSSGTSIPRTAEEELAGFNAGMDSGSGVNAWMLHQGSPTPRGRHSHDMAHTHDVNVPPFPGHTGITGDADNWPPFVDFSLCRKD